MNEGVCFICAMNDPKVFSENLERSLGWLQSHHILQEGCLNVSHAYNEAMKKSTAEILVFVHQDVYLPDNWLKFLKKALEKLKGISWGVLGVAGASLVKGKTQYIGHIQDRGVEWNKTKPEELPKQSQTVDELLFVIKNDGSFVFDEKIPSCDFYAADLCLQAKEQNKKNYVIYAYLQHNSSRQRGKPLPENFYASRKYIIQKWKKLLPVATTCTALG